MLFYIVRRVVYVIPIALAVSLVCFLLVHIAPGDPIDAMVQPDTPQEVIDRVRSEYGLDRPLPVQFGLWLAKLVQGDFGTSLIKGRPVLPDLVSASGATFVLACTGGLLGVLAGCILGGIAGVYRESWLDRVLLGTAVAGVSVPHYWLGMVMVIIFSVNLNLLPAMGSGPGGSTAWAWDWAHLRYLILPSVTLAVIPAGIVTRTVRGLVSDIISQDYITTLRGKGLRRAGIVRHVVLNAAPTVLAVVGLQLANLMGGSILVETVFAWPGTGMMLNTAIFQRDLPVLQATTLLLALFFVVLNLVVDLIQTAIDPRISRR
ncbi:ABC transporter permease [Propylenella binzhouense]|uniref:ABC transporter permease n=1 Tax=Propylenella binzhouense TaxID=2555902 RepID=A0A964WU14_9HYPH|nr:ABC transporter permease [Propylenella binzhouense]MYZ48622.1 ABC transporter permease [Propylenella binzhouense]